MKQRAGIVQKQVAAGREFKVSTHTCSYGCSSISVSHFSVFIFVEYIFTLSLFFFFFFFFFCVLIFVKYLFFFSLFFFFFFLHFRVVHFTANLKSSCSRCVSHSARLDFTRNFSIIYFYKIREIQRASSLVDRCAQMTVR